MTLLRKSGIPLVILTICLSVWFMRFQQEETAPVMQEDPALAATVNTCDGITERAAADLVAIVEFQKLEIAGRKAHVFKMCMRDHGFVENADWLIYSKPFAKKLSKENNVSIDAAIESLGRAEMMLVKGEAHRPNYWVRKEVNAEK